MKVTDSEVSTDAALACNDAATAIHALKLLLLAHLLKVVLQPLALVSVYFTDVLKNYASSSCSQHPEH